MDIYDVIVILFIVSGFSIAYTTIIALSIGEWTETHVNETMKRWCQHYEKHHNFELTGNIQKQCEELDLSLHKGGD